MPSGLELFHCRLADGVRKVMFVLSRLISSFFFISSHFVFFFISSHFFISHSHIAPVNCHMGRPTHSRCAARCPPGAPSAHCRTAGARGQWGSCSEHTGPCGTNMRLQDYCLSRSIPHPTAVSRSLQTPFRGGGGGAIGEDRKEFHSPAASVSPERR